MRGGDFGYRELQWHSLGMFAPSFVTGHLISCLGLTRIMLTGTVLLLLCSLINLSGLATFNFWAANVAFGVGWNFLFVGAMTLLTRTYAGAHSGASGVVEHDDPQTPWTWAASSRDPYGTTESTSLPKM